jgi:predicted transcriptional regulator
VSGLRCLAVSLLGTIFAAGPALAGLDTPLGTLDARLDADREALGAGYEAGADPLLGDDAIVVRETVREAELMWSGSPANVPLAVEAGLRGLVVEHEAFAATAGMLGDAEAVRPPGVPWPYVGPDGIDVDFEVDALYRHPGVPGWPMVLYPDQQYGIGWGVGYDQVTVPNAIAGSSDAAAGDVGGDAAFACTAMAAQAGLALDACQNQAPTLAAVGPELRLHTELQRVTLRTGPAGELPLPVGAQGADLASAPELGAVGGQGDPGRAALPAAPRVGDRVASGREGTSPAEPALSAQGALDGGLAWTGLDTALPLAAVVLALALLAPIAVLYRRLLSHETLSHPIRDDMLQRIRAHPGIHESQLAREMGLRHTHVQYHLRLLEQARIVEERRFGGLKCLFEVGALSEAEKGAAMAERGRGGEVLAALTAEPGIPQRILARRLGMSESSVKWHLDRFAGSGMVRVERTSGSKRVWPASGLPEAPAVEPASVAAAATVAIAVPARIVLPAPRPQP